jgi:hypothetical protein
MKLTTANIAVIMVAIVGISIASTYAIIAEVSEHNPVSGAMMLTGSVKVTQIDGDGNTIALRQSDNHIVGQGMEMIISQVFNQMNGTADADTRPVRWMEIGHSGEWELLMNDTDLRLSADNDPPISATCLRVDATFANVTGPALQGFGANSLVQGVIANNHEPCQIANWAAETGGTNSAFCSAQANVTAQAQFTGANCNGLLTIDEAAMFNDEFAGTMFARNNFGGVVLNTPDTLQLDWEFTFTDS